MKILIIEDDVATTMMMRWILNDLGHQVLAVYKASEALEKGGVFEPDVIVADLNLLDHLDGLEVSRVIQRVHPRAKIIVVTGSLESEIQSADQGEQPYSFLRKPFDLHVLRDLIRNFARSSEPELLVAV